MTTKIQLRAGEVEFTFETDSPVAVSDVRDFLSQVQEIAQSIAPSVPEASSGGGTAKDAAPPAPLMLEDSVPKLHINSVADRVQAKNAPDVAVAAAAFLQIIQGKQSFTRRELLDTMKAATNYYNQNMSGNLSSILKTLVASKFNQLANDTYALKSSELADLRGKLAE